MKTYIDRNFKREYLKGVDLQQVGAYYSVPIRDIFEEKRAEFDYEDLENDTIFAYKVDNYYSPQCDRGIAFDDENLNIDWILKKEELTKALADTFDPKQKAQILKEIIALKDKE